MMISPPSRIAIVAGYPFTVVGMICALLSVSFWTVTSTCFFAAAAAQASLYWVSSPE